MDSDTATPKSGAAPGSVVSGIPSPSGSRTGGAGSKTGARSSMSVFGILEPGDELGHRYRIDLLLGQGGMGRVYKAYDKELERMIALKVLQPELASDPNAMQRFKQELLLASRISHKNILRIHDLGEADGVKFISMAFVEGEDLHHLVRTHGRLPVDRALKIAEQLCEALDAAHSEGVVHRDLKPQNVLIGKNDLVHVVDFGLAKSLEASAAGMTRTGQYLGTPRYMAPEQVEAKPVDSRTDLYALGLIFFEMLTGEEPFKGDSTLQIMYRRVKEKPPSPKDLNPEIPEYFARIILRCLERDPARRYQKAKDILADLQTAHGPSRAKTMHISLPMLERSSWLVGAGIAAAILILVFAIPPVRHLIFRGETSGTMGPAGIPPLASGRFVAVLPLQIIGDASQLGYLAQGIEEALSAKLFQLKDVRVASTDAAGKADQKQPLPKIARALGANLLVQGTLQGVGDKIRIDVNLEDVADGKRLWSKEFNGVTGDVFTLEDDMYNQLVAALDINPTNEEMARAAVRPTENVQAYDLYLKGRSAMRGQQNVKNVNAAIDLYNEALKKDPSFALAYAGLSDASLVMYRETKDSFWSQKAAAVAQQAQQLNPNLAEVHFALGNVYSSTGKYTEAVAELNRALQFAPNSDDGYRGLGKAYLAVGRKGEALQAYEKAIQINPYYWFNYNVIGGAYSRLGEYDKALEAFRRVTELEPDNVFGYLNVGAVYFQQGKYEESLPYFQKALQVQPYSLTYSNVGTVYFYLKRYSDSVPMFEKAVEMNANEQLTMGNLADAYRWSGQRDKANATYDKAIALAYKELEVDPRDAVAMGWLALYYAKKGNTTQALDFMRRARAINAVDVNLIYKEAVVFALAGRPADALKALQEALQKGYSLEETKNDPELGNLQGRPEFVKLLREFSKPR